MGNTRTVVMSGHRVGGFAVRRSVRPYLTSSVAVATAGILAAGFVAGPPEVTVARTEVQGMQLIAILGVAFFVVIPVFWVIIVLSQRNQGRARCSESSFASERPGSPVSPLNPSNNRDDNLGSRDQFDAGRLLCALRSPMPH
jgi:hypothetical protein